HEICAKSIEMRTILASKTRPILGMSLPELDSAGQARPKMDRKSASFSHKKRVFSTKFCDIGRFLSASEFLLIADRYPTISSNRMGSGRVRTGGGSIKASCCWV